MGQSRNASENQIVNSGPVIVIRSLITIVGALFQFTKLGTQLFLTLS